jgi:hypothetical protein
MQSITEPGQIDASSPVYCTSIDVEGQYSGLFSSHSSAPNSTERDPNELTPLLPNEDLSLDSIDDFELKYKSILNAC